MRWKKEVREWDEGGKVMEVEEGRKGEGESGGRGEA